jgi:Asp-tRNA(Asn)/Glu-tRNA(Gln) amidotransferase A subunit family amidase
MTGIWPREPRLDWHAGPMARTTRDLALAYSLLVGPDGSDGFATVPRELDAGLGASPDRPVRVGWLVTRDSVRSTGRSRQPCRRPPTPCGQRGPGSRP